MSGNKPEVAAELMRLTRELIDIPSVSRDEEAVLAYVKAALPSDLEVIHDDDSVFFVSPTRRPGAPFVILAGHTDTVPIENNVPSRTEGEVIHGRGACDMKGSLAVMLMVAQQLANIGTDLDVGFLFFGREELPANDNALLPAFETCEQMRSTDFAILMEPTSNAIEAGCQGNLNLTVTYKGVAAHTARPWRGVNAAHAAISALQELVVREPEDVNIDGLVFREVVSVTGIRSGIARNVIPPEAEVDINVRYSPASKPADVEQMWIERFEGEHASVEIISNAPPAPVVIHHPLVERLTTAGAGAPFPKQAWTNTADFALYDIPAINFGPGDSAFAHRQDEQIDQAALVKSFDVLLSFLTPKAS